MYAIIQDRGRQYRVSEGDCFDVDFLDAARGDRVEFDRVLALGGQKTVQIGSPTVKGAVVVAEVLSQQMDPKIKVQKFHRRKGYRRLVGHRQLHTQLQVREIRSAAKSRRKKKAAEEKAADADA